MHCVPLSESSLVMSVGAAVGAADQQCKHGVGRESGENTARSAGQRGHAFVSNHKLYIWARQD